MTSLLEVLAASKQHGFLGPGAVEDHLEHAQAFVVATPPPGRFLDLGSGGGVPGLVLAATWTSSAGTLLDAQLRRVRFLTEVVEAMGMDDRVRVVHGRAEDLARDPAHRGVYDVVTARSFGPPALTAECAAGFLVEAGAVVVAEPPTLDAARWPAAGLATLGLIDAGVVEGPASAVRLLRSTGSPLATVPRRTAAMRRTPAY